MLLKSALHIQVLVMFAASMKGLILNSPCTYDHCTWSCRNEFLYLSYFSFLVKLENILSIEEVWKFNISNLIDFWVLILHYQHKPNQSTCRATIITVPIIWCSLNTDTTCLDTTKTINVHTRTIMCKNITPSVPFW